MNDFFDNGNSLETDPDLLNTIFESIYGWIPDTRCFLGINLQWPKFDLPENYAQYFLSWHTEQFDLHWLRHQANCVYPRPILVANDGVVDASIFPDNVEFVQWITWGDQLDQLVNRFGVCTEPQLPEYKLSSLSFRVSQYKRFITAYLLNHADHKEIMLTYHGRLGKQEDLHGYPKGFPWLDVLDLELTPTFINFNDGYSLEKNKAVDNGGWTNPAFQDALINFTNESFHYSLSQVDGKPFLYPGPYLTEKTWKPLLAGRPFLAVGQYNTYQTLRDLGLRTDFGFPIEFDQDSGDLTRIRDIFGTIDVILAAPVKDLYEQSLASVRHNAQMIKNGEFTQACYRQNEQARSRIIEFLSV
jgi:hypothetical protein